VKAKDLKGKNIEDIDDLTKDQEEKPEEEEDQVSAAYESLAKKLDSLREGKKETDEPEESKETEEVDELEEADLKPLPGTDESFDSAQDRNEAPVKKAAKDGLVDDPLDEEEPDLTKGSKVKADDLDESFDKAQDREAEEVDGFKKEELKGSEEPDATQETNEREFPEEMPQFVSRRSSFESEQSFDSARSGGGEPDSLDDLTNAEESPHRRSAPFPAQEELSEYDIPNLKSRPTPHSDFSGMDQRRESYYQETPPMRDRGDSEPGDFFNKHQTSVPRKRGSKVHLLILGILGLGVVAFTVYLLKYGFDPGLGGQPSPTPSPTPVVSPTPEPTPEVTIERGNFTVRVLNGTSTTGLAGTVTDKLKELGYKTGRQGNATNSAFEQTVVRVKEGSESASLLQKLIQDLSPDYQAVESEPLPDNATSDAEVILGKK